MPDAGKYVNGTYGNVWVDDELWAETEKFEAKVTIDYEDVNIPGSGATHKKAIGWKGDGSMTIKKVYSRAQQKMAEKVRRGEYPRLKIVGKVEDPDALGSERVAIYDVTPNEFMLIAFEQKKIIEETIPFSFSDFEPVDMITP